MFFETLILFVGANWIIIRLPCCARSRPNGLKRGLSKSVYSVVLIGPIGS